MRQNNCWSYVLIGSLSFLILLIGQPQLQAADTTLDSLRAVLTQTPDTLLAKEWLAFSDEWEAQKQWDSAYWYGEKAYQSGLQYKDTLQFRAALFQLSYISTAKGDSSLGDSLWGEAIYLQALYGYRFQRERYSFNNAYRYSSIRSSLFVLLDSSQSLSFDSVLTKDIRTEFQLNHYLGVPDKKEVYWVHFRFHGHPDTAELATFLMGIDNATWDTIDVYLANRDSGWTHTTTGIQLRPEEKTAYQDWRSIIQVPVEAGESRRMYLRLSGISTRRQPSTIFLAHLHHAHMSETEPRAKRNMGIFFWILVVQGLYFLLLFLSTRENTYVPYLVYLMGVILYAFTVHYYHSLFHGYVDYNWMLIFTAIGLAGVGLLSFALRYLNIRKLSPFWYRFTRIFIGVFAIPPAFMVGLFVAGAVFGGKDGPDVLNSLATIMVSATFLSVSFGLIVTILLGFLALKKGYKPAGSYLIGMMFLILLVGLTPLFAIFFPMWLVGILSFEGAVLAAQIGVVLQLVFFALGVGQKINLLEQEHANALTDKLSSEQEANEKLRQANRMKDDFIANTSHELRTPLNGILGLSESIHDGVTGPTTPEMRENLNMVINSARRLSGLVNDLLDFSKLKNYDIELQLRSVDIGSLAQVVMKVSESMLHGKPLALATEVPPDLPPVLADENRLQQILYNLIGNAIKFTDQGEVRLKAVQEGTLIRIYVLDTGIGIAKEKQGRIFQSFEQADGSVAREYGGTGLGLSITRQLVELHGGTISVDSTPGVGSNFSFALPISNLPAETNEAEVDAEGLANRFGPAASSTTKVASDLISTTSSQQLEIEAAQFHILVVDDEPVNRQVLKNHLSTEQYWVTTAMNGIEALKAIESGQHFDLILLDVMMPNLSGFEVCQRVREKYLPSELPIIMVTAKNQVSDLVTGLNQGANDYIVKPFSKTELLARIKTHLNLLRINAATSRFVPYEFLRAVGRETITEVKLGDQVERIGTVLFSDIRGYTRLAEHMSPEETFGFLNAYLGRMGPVIQDNQGFVNQFYGDGIMALFLNEPLHGLQAAIAMIQTLHEYNAERHDKGRNVLRIGIGLHSGSLMMGMIGDDNRLDTGLVSDTVNTSARLESLTKWFGADIVLSEDVCARIPRVEVRDIRFLGKVQLAGKSDLIRIYECYAGNLTELREQKRLSQPLLDQALEAYYRQEFEQAVAQLEQILEQNPFDRAVQKLLINARRLEEKDASLPWTGALDVQQK
ncbi:MAG: response regulator [Bacteroidota bacterium]